MRQLSIILEKLKIDLDKIIKYIDLIKVEGEYINKLKNHKEFDNFTKVLKDNHNSVVKYNAVIISIYGSFEKYIDELATNYVYKIIELSKTYSEIPQPIKDTYLRNVGEYFSNPNRFPKDIPDREVVIQNFSDFTNDIAKKLTNTYFFVKHAGNLTSQNVNTLFNSLDVNKLLQNITSNESFINSLKEIDGDNDQFHLLNRLIGERNIISHGITEERIDFNIIVDEIIPFIILFSKLINDEVIKKVYTFLLLRKDSSIVKLSKKYKCINNKIICLNTLNTVLCKGDKLLIKTPNGDYFISSVVKIEIENEEYENASSNIDVGLELDKKIKKDYDFYMLVA